MSKHLRFIILAALLLGLLPQLGSTAGAYPANWPATSQAAAPPPPVNSTPAGESGKKGDASPTVSCGTSLATISGSPLTIEVRPSGSYCVKRPGGVDQFFGGWAD